MYSYIMCTVYCSVLYKSVIRSNDTVQSKISSVTSVLNLLFFVRAVNEMKQCCCYNRTNFYSNENLQVGVKITFFIIKKLNYL